MGNLLWMPMPSPGKTSVVVVQMVRRNEIWKTSWRRPTGSPDGGDVECEGESSHGGLPDFWSQQLKGWPCPPVRRGRLWVEEIEVRSWQLSDEHAGLGMAVTPTGGGDEYAGYYGSGFQERAQSSADSWPLKPWNWKWFSREWNYIQRKPKGGPGIGLWRSPVVRLWWREKSVYREWGYMISDKGGKMGDVLFYFF